MQPHVRHRAAPKRRLLAVFALVALVPAAALGGPSAASTTCGPDQVRTAGADAWIDQGSPQTNRGSDSILKVRSQGPAGNFRALVRFALPAAPEGCVLESATLRLYAAAARGGRMLEARRLSSTWSEGGVTWATQPAATGDAAVASSALGWRQWTVTAQVAAMYAAGNHGFSIRDAAEGESGEQQFHSREKGSNVPQLVLRFAAAPVSEPPPELACGDVVTASAQLTSDLVECPGHGLVIGAANITLDLGGRTVDGRGLGVGILNDGFDGVTIRNGTVREFERGLRLGAGTEGALVERLTVELNGLAGIEVLEAGAAAAPNRIRSSTVHRNGNGVRVAGGAGNVVAGNDVAWSANRAIAVEGSTGTRLEGNRIGDAGDLAVLLERADGNAVVGNTFAGVGDTGLLLSASDGNTITGNGFSGLGDGGMTLRDSDGNVVAGNTAANTSDAAFTLEDGSDENLVQRNVVTGTTNDDAFSIRDSSRNRILDNVAHGAGDSGIFLARAHDNVVRGNDLRFNVGALELDHANGNRIEANDGGGSGAIAIELSGSFGNSLVSNIASQGGARGIVVTGAADAGTGNVLEGNVADANNGSGIVVSAAGHTLRQNVARDNGGWGIHAAAGTVDGGGNRALRNAEPAQCFGIGCLLTDADPAPCDAVALAADADAWVDQGSPQANKGSDSILKVRSQGPSGNFRTLVRFALPPVAEGCELESATLRLYAGADSSYGGRTLEARRVTSSWSEHGVTWANQPATADPAAATASGGGYREWTVTTHVEAMLAGANHGFLVRDRTESGGGAEQQLHSREKGQNVPQLVLAFRQAG